MQRSAVSSPVRSEHDDPSHDVRAGQHSAAELSGQAAQRLSVLGEMAGGIAHDFRNLLTVIDASLCLLAREAEEPKNTRAYIDAARTGVERGLELISQLLSLAGKPAGSVQSSDVNGVLCKLDLFLKYAAGPDVQIIRSLAVALPSCVLDVADFTSAILNLVINARDAMPNGGRIQISTAHVEAAVPGAATRRSYVKVAVADTGHGMTDDLQKRIFEPFFTTKGDKGTGLGLPQLHAFMRRAGGHIVVTSRPQRGTAFELFFPIAASLRRGYDETQRVERKA